MATVGRYLLTNEGTAALRRLARLASGLVLVAAILSPLPRAYADDMAMCNTQNWPPDQAIAACDRLINSGKFRGSDLASRHVDRGVAWRRKGDSDHALSGCKPMSRPSLSIRNSMAPMWIAPTRLLRWTTSMVRSLPWSRR